MTKAWKRFTTRHETSNTLPHTNQHGFCMHDKGHENISDVCQPLKNKDINLYHYILWLNVLFFLWHWNPFSGWCCLWVKQEYSASKSEKFTYIITNISKYLLTFCKSYHLIHLYINNFKHCHYINLEKYNKKLTALGSFQNILKIYNDKDDNGPSSFNKIRLVGQMTLLCIY